MSWTDERVDRLKKLWAEGLSASQIAGDLGDVTRNAVIGKVHRLGLSGRSKTPGQAPVVRSKRSVKLSSFPSRASRLQQGAAGSALRINGHPAGTLSGQELVAPEPLMLTLTELSESTCKWPIGDPATEAFHFCGNVAAENGPYCSFHARVAYQPVAERRRERSVVSA
jgi:GcrA cell cycle regulator